MLRYAKNCFIVFRYLCPLFQSSFASKVSIFEALLFTAGIFFLLCFFVIFSILALLFCRALAKKMAVLDFPLGLCFGKSQMCHLSVGFLNLGTTNSSNLVAKPFLAMVFLFFSVHCIYPLKSACLQDTSIHSVNF